MAAASFVECAIGKSLAIAARSPRIEIEHGVTVRRVNLECGIESVAEHPMRTAVDTKNHRVFAIFAPAEWPHQPALDRNAVETSEDHALCFSHLKRSGRIIMS